MEHVKETIETLHALRNLGVQLSSDDFGTGYSSMAYLNLTVNAEGVESKQQLAFLKAHGCDEMQGYYFCPPVPPAELGELLRSGRRLDSNSTA